MIRRPIARPADLRNAVQPRSRRARSLVVDMGQFEMMPSDVALIIQQIADSPVVSFSYDKTAGEACVVYATAAGTSVAVPLSEHMDSRAITRRVYRALLIKEVLAAAGIAEAHELITILKDETQSGAVHRRCEAWLGEKR